MAASSLTPTLVKRTKTSGELTGIFTLAIGAGDYAAGGLAFTSTFSQKAGFTSRKPDWVTVIGISGYFYEYVYSTGKLQIRAQTNAAAEDAPLGEIADGATPAGIVADTIRARVGYFTTPALPAI